MSIPALLSPAIVIILVLMGFGASAGVLKHWDSYAKPEHFFDWTYARKVWFEMGSWEAEEAEWAKYAADFDPWLALYKKDKRGAMAAIKSYPKEKRINVERAHDIQLAYDQWFDQVYKPWFKGYAYAASQAPIHNRTAPTFDDYLAVWAKRPPCVPAHFLNECGPVPDWRSDKWLAEEQEMMRKANEAARAKHGKK